MEERIKNLCAPIPESLHEKVRQKQGESGKNLGEYMAWLITEFYKQEGVTMMKGDQRTVAFQVDAELFAKFKEFLKTKGIKQNAFFVDCIRKALDEVAAAEASQGEEV